MSKPLKSKAQEALEFLDDLEDFSDLAPAEEGSGDDVAADAGRPHHDDDDTEAASASSAAGADEGKEAEDALKFLNGAFSVDLRLAGCGEGRGSRRAQAAVGARVCPLVEGRASP